MILRALRWDIIHAFYGIKSRFFNVLINTLGVMIGIATLVVLMAVSEKTKKVVLEDIKTLGINTFYLKNSSNNLLTLQTFNKLKHLFGNDLMMIPLYIKEQQECFILNKSFKLDLLATDSLYLYINDIDILSGRILVQEDTKNLRQVVLLSQDMEKLGIKLHENIIINNEIYTIIGFFKTKDSTTRKVIIPYSTILDPDSILSRIYFYSEDSNKIFYFADQIENKLLYWFNDKSSIDLVLSAEIINSAQKTDQNFTFLVSIIGVMSLISGGIGIMSSLLVNISDNTREIGMRLAVGATPYRIVQLYLIHALIISLIGAFLGIILGGVILFIISFFTTLYVDINWYIVTLPVISLLFVSIIFGIYPAIRASQIEPIDALREF